MIDRSRYLSLCRECAMIRERGTFGVPEHVPARLRVVCRGIEYYPQGYELTFRSDGTGHPVAILHDLKANSILRTQLKDVTAKVDYNEESGAEN